MQALDCIYVENTRVKLLAVDCEVGSLFSLHPIFYQQLCELFYHPSNNGSQANNRKFIFEKMTKSVVILSAKKMNPAHSGSQIT